MLLFHYTSVSHTKCFYIYKKTLERTVDFTVRENIIWRRNVHKKKQFYCCHTMQ